MYAVIERKMGMIERVLVTRSSRHAMRAYGKLLKENDVEIEQEMLDNQGYADGDGLEVKITDATFIA